MPKAAFCGLPHSESEVYYVKSCTIGRQPAGTAILRGAIAEYGNRNVPASWRMPLAAPCGPLRKPLRHGSLPVFRMRLDFGIGKSSSKELYVRQFPLEIVIGAETDPERMVHGEIVVRSLESGLC